MSVASRLRVIEERLLSDSWGVLKTTRLAWRRDDGEWQEVLRETYDRGNGAAILPYDPERGTVLLVRQFRYPAFVNGHEDLLVEAAAGLLDAAAPEERIRRETEEELGLRLGEVEQVFDVFMSPGSVTERLHLFVARYSAADRVSEGGGDPAEGEEIDVLELGIGAALAAVRDGRICDAKTVILLQHAALHIFRGAPETEMR
jgi:nudix-type nucleoside diphosphatase (YffH/AdpP family)